MPRYIPNKDSNAREFEERRDYRNITRNDYKKEEQHEMVRPIFSYLKRRFADVIGRQHINAVSLQTGQTYNHVRDLLANSIASPTFYDVMRLAQVAGTSLDYLASLADLDLYELEKYDVSKVRDPGRLFFLTQEEADVVQKFRQLSPNTRAAIAERFLTTVEETPPPAVLSPKKTTPQRQPRTPVSSGPVSK